MSDRHERVNVGRRKIKMPLCRIVNNISIGCNDYVVGGHILLIVKYRSEIQVNWKSIFIVIWSTGKTTEGMETPLKTDSINQIIFRAARCRDLFKHSFYKRIIHIYNSDRETNFQFFFYSSWLSKNRRRITEETKRLRNVRIKQNVEVLRSFNFNKYSSNS